jgi:hypothetical protein
VLGISLSSDSSVRGAILDGGAITWNERLVEIEHYAERFTMPA